MWSMIPSEPASAENCGSKLISALVSATRSVFAGSAAHADAAHVASASRPTAQAVATYPLREGRIDRCSEGSAGVDYNRSSVPPAVVGLVEVLAVLDEA